MDKQLTGCMESNINDIIGKQVFENVGIVCQYHKKSLPLHSPFHPLFTKKNITIKCKKLYEKSK